MNDEIKEIIDKLQRVANRETASRNALMEMKDTDYRLLLDYITNLQQRIDKAIEYMQIFVDFDECLINGKSFQKAIDILRGSDKE